MGNVKDEDKCRPLHGAAAGSQDSAGSDTL
jgi:hypothetical protein